MNDQRSDQQLLLEYTERRSEDAFGEVVRRHVNVVYSAARRMLSDPSLAQDVTQQVFLALAADAQKLSRHPVLCGWLHRTTRNLVRNVLRSENRRCAREKEAARMQEEFECKLGHDYHWGESACGPGVRHSNDARLYQQSRHRRYLSDEVSVGSVKA